MKTETQKLFKDDFDQIVEIAIERRIEYKFDEFDLGGTTCVRKTTIYPYNDLYLFHYGYGNLDEIDEITWMGKEEFIEDYEDNNYSTLRY